MGGCVRAGHEVCARRRVYNPVALGISRARLVGHVSPLHGTGAVWTTGMARRRWTGCTEGDEFRAYLIGEPVRTAGCLLCLAGVGPLPASWGVLGEWYFCGLLMWVCERLSTSTSTSTSTWVFFRRPLQ